MSLFDTSFYSSEFSKRTSIFGLRLWVVIGIFVGAIIVVFLFLISLCMSSRRRRKPRYRTSKVKNGADLIPPVNVSRDIREIVNVNRIHRQQQQQQHVETGAEAVPEIQIEIGKVENRIGVSDGILHASGESSRGNTDTNDSGSVASSGHGHGGRGGGGNSGGVLPEVSHLGWGRWYTLRELEIATNGLADENVIGEGGYGIVYSGVLSDSTKVAIKNLLNNRGQAEKEFKVEVEAIGRVRHKNLVRLLGFCVEGAYRMLVYEYVDNGNLDEWLHGDVGEVSPLTWDIRMNIILGIAKGLAYLHEGLEPKVVHRDVKSNNILLDRQWNPKVSDFGLAKLICSERTYVTTRVMGTFGYVAPEYACTGMLNEKSDIYSFGILLMEILSGRSPVDYSRPDGEVNLVDWLKAMIGNRKAEEIVDPKLPDVPSSKALKRVILIALRCVDPDTQKRPKMGNVVHMLEADDLLFCSSERKIGKETSRSDYHGDTSEGGDSSRSLHQQTRWT